MAGPSTVQFSSNEKVLFLLNKHTGLAPYSHEFIFGGVDPQLLSGFVTAMGSFLAEFVGSEETGWKTVYGSDTTFVVELYDWVVGVLAVSRETTELRSRLRRVVREFKDSFDVLKDSDGINGRLFTEFDEFVMKVFVADRVAPQSIVKRRAEWKDSLERFEIPKTYPMVNQLIQELKGSMAVSELAAKHSLSIKDTRDTVSVAYWHNAVHIKYIPSERDILEISDRALSTILDSSNPLGVSAMTIGVVGSLDGRSPLEPFYEGLKESKKETVLNELGDLLLSGHIHKISIERESVLVNECILNSFADACAELLGAENVQNVIREISSNGIPNHPWLSRVRILDGVSVQCALEETTTPKDLDSMAAALDYMLQNLVDNMSKNLAEADVEDLLRYARWHCQEEWLPGLGQAVL
ncbi:MAG: hypothetical protein ACE5H4_04665 [Candidatus Thorarchaeota archaeon]